MTDANGPTTRAAPAPLLSWRTLSALADRRLLIFAGGLLAYGGTAAADDETALVYGLVKYGGAAAVIVILHVVGTAWLAARRALLARACADAAAALPVGTDARRELEATRALVVQTRRGKVLAQLEARLHYLAEVVAREGPTAQIALDGRSLQGLPEH